MILDCLRYWVEHMHVDGFRFDLAASLSRGEDGQPLARPPILLDIEADPVLAGTKIIAEAWDAAGLYQLANFGGDRWAVWNGQYRDHVRRFVKGDPAIGRAAGRQHRRQRESVSARRPPAEPQRQLHHRPRRLHAQRPRDLQRQAQRRPTARRTATARTTTSAGTAASRVRPTTRRSKRSAGSRSRIFSRSCCCRRVGRCC